MPIFAEYNYLIMESHFQPKCCPFDQGNDCHCDPCMPKLQSTIDYAFRLCGGIGLFFSFTEVSK